MMNLQSTNVVVKRSNQFWYQLAVVIGGFSMINGAVLIFIGIINIASFSPTSGIACFFFGFTFLFIPLCVLINALLRFGSHRLVSLIFDSENTQNSAPNVATNSTMGMSMEQYHGSMTLPSENRFSSFVGNSEVTLHVPVDEKPPDYQTVAANKNYVASAPSDISSKEYVNASENSPNSSLNYPEKGGAL